MAKPFVWTLIGLGENLVAAINTRGKEIQRILADRNVEVLATSELPPPGASQAGKLVIEDAGAGDGNLVFYTNSERFRIDGGIAF